MNAKPTPPSAKKKASVVPWGKNFLPDQGPKINGSSLQYTSSSSKAFKIPEARA